LEIEPYGNRITQVGDIIVFERSGDGQAVVHRIIDLTPSGICTRGDGNASADRYLVQPEDITGRVIAAWRGNQRRKIPGGKVASIRVNLSCHRQRLNRLICDSLYPLYTTSARSGVIHRLLPTRLQPRIVTFQTGDHQQLRLFLGRHSIGHYEDDWNRWIIRRPFRLLVDERQLPGPRDFDEDRL